MPKTSPTTGFNQLSQRTLRAVAIATAAALALSGCKAAEAEHTDSGPGVVIAAPEHSQSPATTPNAAYTKAHIECFRATGEQYGDNFRFTPQAQVVSGNPDPKKIFTLGRVGFANGTAQIAVVPGIAPVELPARAAADYTIVVLNYTGEKTWPGDSDTVADLFAHHDAASADNFFEIASACGLFASDDSLLLTDTSPNA